MIIKFELNLNVSSLTLASRSISTLGTLVNTISMNKSAKFRTDKCMQYFSRKPEGKGPLAIIGRG
jgi:hypothetical protein